MGKKMKQALNMSGTVMAVISTLFHMIGFSSGHWLEAFPSIHSRFDRLGLWTACFNNFGYDKDQLGKLYDGCHWIYSYEFRPIFDWLNPPWLLTVQIVMTLALITNVIVCLLCGLGWLRDLFPHVEARTQYTKAGMMFLSAAFMSLSVSLFGVMADTDRQWIPRPDRNYLSWSFGLAIMGAFFGIFAAMCLLFDGLRITFETQDKMYKAQGQPYVETYRMEKQAPPEY